MLHLRLVCPPFLVGQLCDLLDAEPGVTNIVVLPGAARQPPGDLVMCDVVREAGSEVLARLRELGLSVDGSIAVHTVDTTLSEAADRAAERVPGYGADAVVWEEIEARTSEESTLSWTYLAFMTIATLIAGVGVLVDQPILIVGAMVVGPEFGPLAGLSVAVVRRQWPALWASARALLVGFAVAMTATLVLAAVGRLVGAVQPRMLDREAALTAFISRPDGFSLLIAMLAGAAGILSLTSAKSGALIGVLISVTTVPAAGNAAVALALGHLGVAGGALLQLLVNLTGIVAAAVTVLSVQRWAQDRGRRTAPTPAR
ncbi:MAG TPA: DUF389 domain-containing protein [Mycobacteriales bacterium]|nr:DUF389 domain-containing protein [Mycobacteriales bacterium]